MCYGNPKIIFLLFSLLSWESVTGYCNTQNRRSATPVNEVDYLTNLIETAQKNALTYQFPKNADRYKPTDENKIEDFGTYDFIIVGAGGSGTVVASRLSENDNFNVLLLEAGDFGNNFTDIPAMYFPVEYTDYNWGFFSTPQKTCCLGMVDKKCPLPRGRGVGGSTLINGGIYARGSRLDFDRWAKHVNDSTWSYEKVLPYFKKSEDFHHRDKAAPVYEPVHGKGGLWNVEYHLPRSPQLNSWLAANEELGYGVADYNSGTGLGASPFQLNTINGRRLDGGKAFIHPFLGRKNLHLVKEAYVTKILIDHIRSSAEGVVFTLHHKKYTAKASKEVIMSAGVFQTPQLLMLSGIGPKKHLESLNIPVVKNLQVGSFLKDHPTFYGVVFGSNYTEPTKPLKEQVEEYLRGYGALSLSGNNQGVGFFESKFTKGTGYPDIEIGMVPAVAISDLSQRTFSLTDQTYEDLWKPMNRSQSYITYVISLHAESTGTVRLNSSDPYEYPIVDVNFLSDPKGKDIETICEGVQILMNLSKTQAFQKIGAKLGGRPLKACKEFEYLSKPYWYCAIRQVTMNIYHPASTCPMGNNPERGDVVDSHCKVHGIKKLRIADASVFPFSLAGHPTAAVVMVGEVVSDLIKKEYQ
ncbi:glucose dehydrogenase [FAD, quinone] [Leptinotarsa decemlineata]|uniref:glucose dehydrogenase [FAD, quinone] n=1 Tax=Leptinotarsa decemlineata TaxID=7539 RepID=UPI003D3092BA